MHVTRLSRLPVVALLLAGTASAQAPSITDVSPNRSTFSTNGLRPSVSGLIPRLAISSDGSRLYAGTFSGVWRADATPGVDPKEIIPPGESWKQLTWSQPGPGESVQGALPAPDVWEVVVSPVDRDRVLVIARGDTRIPGLRRNGIFLTRNGGSTWDLVLPVSAADDCINYWWDPANNHGTLGQIVFAPDDPTRVYAAIGCAIMRSVNQGETWSEIATLTNLNWVPGCASPDSNRAWHIAVGPAEGGGIRRLYAAGNSRLFYSSDDGATWCLVEGTSSLGGFGGGITEAVHPSTLVIDPTNPLRVYMIAQGMDGPKYLCANTPPGTRCTGTGDPNQDTGLCLEPGLWLGDFTQFSNSHQAAWSRRNPPVYCGGGSSGAQFVKAVPSASGFYLLYCHMTHTFICHNDPDASWKWHRLDGPDYSTENARYTDYVHVDGHDAVVGPGFEVALVPPLILPFTNTVVETHTGGAIWLANDGGVYRSMNLAVTGNPFELVSGTPKPAAGPGANPVPGTLSTLNPGGVTGLAMVQPAGSLTSPGLYMGTDHNDAFSASRGGAAWAAAEGCGDCGVWFPDHGQPNRIIGPGRGANLFTVHEVLPGNLVLPGVNSTRRGIPCPPGENGCDQVVRTTSGESQLIVQTPLGQSVESMGHLAFLWNKPGSGWGLYHTKQIDNLSGYPNDWNEPSIVTPVAQLPPGDWSNGALHAVGGHTDTQYYLGNLSDALYRLDPGIGWIPIVGNGYEVTTARRFFVNPYDPDEIYVLADDHIYHSTSGGLASWWNIEVSLENAVTDNGEFMLAPDPPNLASGASYGTQTFPAISRMFFSRMDPRTRLAVGAAGVHYTLDGTNWRRLMSSTALPGHGLDLFFDELTESVPGQGPDRAVYVGFDGRGVIRIQPLPTATPPWPSKCWVGNGTRIDVDSNAQSHASSAPDGASGVYVAYLDSTGGPAHPFLQRITSPGAVSPGWPAGGLPLTSSTADQAFVRVAADAVGGPFVTWSDDSVRVQHASANGTVAPGWPANGRAVFAALGDTPSNALDGAGGVFVSVAEASVGGIGPLRLQRLSANGEVASGWPTGGALVAPAVRGGESNVMIGDGSGGVYVAWPFTTSSSAYNVYIQHMTGAGTRAPGWFAGGVTVAGATKTGSPPAPGLVGDGAAGAIVAWLDGSRILAQRVAPNGTKLWSPSTGVVLCEAAGGCVGGAPVAVADGSGGAFVGWIRPDNRHVMAQRVDAAGQLVLGSPAVLCSTSTPKLGLKGVSDSAGVAIFAWSEQRGPAGWDLYGQCLTDDGALAAGWPASGHIISDAAGDQRDVALAGVGGGGVIAAWTDTRPPTGSAIYADCIAPGSSAILVGVEDGTAGPPKRLLLAPVRPNPAAGDVTIDFELATAARLSLAIYDLAGRRLRQLEPGRDFGAGRHRVTWDGRTDEGTRSRPGVYFVSLRSGGETVVRKTIRLE